MLSIAEIKEELGPEPQIPKRQYSYVGYKDGEVFHFDTRDEVEKFKLNERIFINKQEVDEGLAKLSAYNAKVFDRWYSLLQEEYKDINSGVFKVIYNKAYEDGHDCGYDEVACEFNSLYHFYKECLCAKPLG
jgi:hypothetical protein